MDRTSQPVLFDRLDWYQLLLRYCRFPGEALFVHASGSGARIVLPLLKHGAGGRALHTHYSLGWQPVFCPASGRGPDAKLLAAALAALREQGLATLTLKPMEEASALWLGAALSRGGWAVRKTQCSATWFVRTQGMSFEKYWAARPSQLRNTVARKAKKEEFEFRTFDDFVKSAWDDYEAVYADSWKPEESAPALLRALATQEGAAGTLRLGIAYRGERPVAAQFWLVEDGRATIHKLAYRCEEKAASPGTLLTWAMFAFVMERDAPSVIDFGLGDEGYKRDWMDESRPMYRLEAFKKRSIRGLTGLARHKLALLVPSRSGR